MNVKHGLAGVTVRVYHGAIARLPNSFRKRDLGRGERKSPDECGVGRLVERRHMLPRNDHDMNRRLGIDVPKRHDVFVLEHERRRNLAANDAAK